MHTGLASIALTIALAIAIFTTATANGSSDMTAKTRSAGITNKEYILTCIRYY